MGNACCRKAEPEKEILTPLGKEDQGSEYVAAKQSTRIDNENIHTMTIEDDKKPEEESWDISEIVKKYM